MWQHNIAEKKKLVTEDVTMFPRIMILILEVTIKMVAE